MNIMSKPQVCQGAHKVPWRPSLMDLPNELLERILEVKWPINNSFLLIFSDFVKILNGERILFDIY